MTSARTYLAELTVQEALSDGTTRRPWRARAGVWPANRTDLRRTGHGSGKAPEVAMRRALDEAMAELRQGAPRRKPGA